MIKTFLLIATLHFQVESDTIPLINSSLILEQVDELNKNKNYSESISLLKKVLPYDSNYVDVQSKLVRTYSLNGQFAKAEKIGLNLIETRTDLPSDFYITFGNEYLNNNLIQKGIEIYQDGLESFPFNISMRYNIGFSEYSLGHYLEAITHMQEIIKINPYYSRAHQMLGNIMSKTNQRTKAVLSFLAYLAINSDQNWALVKVNNLLSDGYREEGSLEINLDNSQFEYYDQLLRSKAALDDRFKSTVDFEAPVAQQTELLINKLRYNKNTKDFWMEFYVPFLESISNEGLTDAFVYFILYSSNNENVTSWVNKHEKEKNEWVNIVQSYFNQFKSVNLRTVSDSTDTYSHWYYNDGTVSAIGNEKGENNIGPYEFYYQNGRIKAAGSYDKSGNKIGIWKYYHNNGQVRSKESYQNGLAEGVIDFYKSNGKLNSSGEYEKGELNGFLRWYYSCGEINEEYPYVQGVGSGNGTVYHKTGEVKITYSVKNNMNDGPYTLYYKTGQKANEYTYKDGLLEGDYRSYYADGSEAEIGYYKNDKQYGNWISYEQSGLQENKGTFYEGKKTGLWEYFYSNGNKKRIENYNDSGELHGLTIWYDIDGKIHSERKLDNGVLVQYKFFDKSGRVLIDKSNVDGNMDYIGYYSNGEIYSKGTLEGGIIQGPYTTYHHNGNVEFQGTMLNDEWNGPLNEYKKTGKIATSSNYQNGLLTGYYRSYHNNGNVSREGWLNEGEIQQRWVEYRPDGSIESDGYYTNGAVHEVKFYDSKERLTLIEFYDDDEILLRIEQYDTLGSRYNVADISPENNTLELKSTTGQLTMKKTKKCGEDVGERIYYSSDKIDSRYTYENSELKNYYSYNILGQTTIEGNYLNDQKHGKWYFYDDDGQLEYVSSYISGEREGTSIAYYKNGQIESECERYKDDRIGPCNYYEAGGKLQLIKYYTPEYGAYAYQYMQSEGQLSDTIQIDYKSDFELKSYYSNGNLAVIQQLKMGYFEGQNIYYSPEGKIISKSSYVDGVSHGKDEEFYLNGQLKHEENHQYGELHGLENYYYQNGQLKESIQWHHGTKEGWNRIYDENGQLLSEIFYRNDSQY